MGLTALRGAAGRTWVTGQTKGNALERHLKRKGREQAEAGCGEGGIEDPR